jgi:hypothetical protein
MRISASISQTSFPNQCPSSIPKQRADQFKDGNKKSQSGFEIDVYNSSMDYSPQLKYGLERGRGWFV